MLPVGILMSFAAMKLLGLGSNIMSLGGIAIAVGAMIDAAIVTIENAHKHLERAPAGKARIEESQEGRLFGPLAFTKTFAMAAAAILSVTLVPALMVLFIRCRIVPEHRNPLNRLLIWVSRLVIRWVLSARVVTILVALLCSGPLCGRRASSARSSCPT